MVFPYVAKDLNKCPRLGVSASIFSVRRLHDHGISGVVFRVFTAGRTVLSCSLPARGYTENLSYHFHDYLLPPLRLHRLHYFLRPRLIPLSTVTGVVEVVASRQDTHKCVCIYIYICIYTYISICMCVYVYIHSYNMHVELWLYGSGV